jgi:hypothetical protein
MKLGVILFSSAALFIATAAYAQQPPAGSFQSYGNSGNSPTQPGYVRPMPNGGYIVQSPNAPTDTHPLPDTGSVNSENPSGTYPNSSGGSAEAPEAPSGPERSGNNH